MSTMCLILPGQVKAVGRCFRVRLLVHSHAGRRGTAVAPGKLSEVNASAVGTSRLRAPYLPKSTHSFTLTGAFFCISRARSRWPGKGWKASTNSIVTSICSAATCLLSSLLSHLETISATPASRRIRGKSFAIWARRSSTEAVPKPCWFRVACHSLPSVAAGRVWVLVHGERPGQ